MDPYTLFWIEAILMNFAELKRWQVRRGWLLRWQRRRRWRVRCLQGPELNQQHAAGLGSKPPCQSFHQLFSGLQHAGNASWVSVLVHSSPAPYASPSAPQDFKAPGSQAKQYFLGLEAVLGGSGNPAYPGGQFFNMFNLGKTPEAMKKLQVGAGWRYGRRYCRRWARRSPLRPNNVACCVSLAGERT